MSKSDPACETASDTSILSSGRWFKRMFWAETLFSMCPHQKHELKSTTNFRNAQVVSPLEKDGDGDGDDDDSDDD